MAYETYEVLDNASLLLKLFSEALEDDGKVSLSEIFNIVSKVGLEIVNDISDEEAPVEEG